jgi:Fe-S oxidoreductase/nitrate reductase gamma subunit
MSESLSSYGTTIEEASRPIYWNLPSIYNQVALYIIFAISLLVLFNGIFQRIILWRRGNKNPQKRPLTIERIFWAIANIGFQRKVSQDKQAGIFHALIVFGFLILLITTTAVFLQHDFGLNVYKGIPYLVLTVLSDAFGFLFLIGISLAYKRRYLEAPDKLHSNSGDRFMLQLLAWLLVQGFLLEGLRIHATEDPWAAYSFVGLAVSKFFWSLSANATSYLHFGIWWIHAITFFVFLALLPYTKFLHIISSSLNLFFLELHKPKGTIKNPGDLEKLLESAMESGDEDFSLGTSTIMDLDWKTRLDLDACTSCGRCQDVCPAYNSGKILSPKWLILDTRDHMLSLHANNLFQSEEIKTNSDSPLSSVLTILKKIDSILLSFFLLKESPSLYPDRYKRANNELTQNATKEKLGKDQNARLAGEVMDEDVFWSCTTCRACMEVCPVGIEHVDLIVETRRNLLLIQGTAPSEAQPVLRAIESQGTPLGDAQSRQDWTAGLSIPFIKGGDSVDILYWVGCISAFDTRKQKIAKAMVSILNTAGVSWGMLGNLERCTGDPARRLGDENTFQQSAKINIGTFRSLSFKRIVTHCPHCFNTIKNEYPDFGQISDTPVEILHHSTFIKDLIDKKKIQLLEGKESTITFHDPCYLGRYNDVYEEPRETLVQLGNKKVTEMKSHKKKSMCCGAGGGHYWFDMKVGERVNVQRVEEASETGADTIATACPFCMQMIEDGIKLKNKEDQMRVRDIAELVAEGISQEQTT